MSITKTVLMDIDKRERMFFVLLGFACNEIIILQKVALAIDVFNRDTEGIERQAYTVQASFITRLLIAKMFEAWEKLFKKLFFKSPFGRDYEPDFSPKAKEALADLRKFFGQNTYIIVVTGSVTIMYVFCLSITPHRELL